MLHGKCLSGALCWGDSDRLGKAAGFADPRLVSDRSLGNDDPAIAAMLDGIAFHSATYRLFKLDEVEPQCEQYSQAIRYRGTVPGAERAFALDGHHLIETGRLLPMCGNTWNLLAETRFARHFAFFGDFTGLFGVFAGCGTSSPFGSVDGQPETEGCC